MLPLLAAMILSGSAVHHLHLHVDRPAEHVAVQPREQTHAYCMVLFAGDGVGRVVKETVPGRRL